MNQTITLPIEVVERALASLESEFGKHSKSASDIRAALKQPQNHVPDAGNMMPAGWKLVPVVPTIRQMAAMGPAIRACYNMDGVSGNVVDVYRAMLAAAPQPPTTEQSSVVQPQVEQEPVAFMHDVVAYDGEPDQALSFSKDNFPLEGLGGFRSVGIHPLYTKPQPKREPLTLAQIAEVFGWKPGYPPTPDQVHDARAIEAAHGIGGEA